MTSWCTGYVLMPEHVHLLLSEPKNFPLSKSFRVLKTLTSRRLKGDRPQFWQVRYYDFNVPTASKHIESSGISIAIRSRVGWLLPQRSGRGPGIITG